MSVLDLARADIRALQPYSSARMEARGGAVLLNANESPWPALPDEAAMNRYPDPQPAALIERLAATFGVDASCVLAARGSDEAIDLLVRAFCRAERDAVAICPPTFGMYAVAARIQGAAVVDVPLDATFSLDADALLARIEPAVKLVFLCSPNNPTGGLVELAAIERVVAGLAGRALVVVDEAYIEFADAPSAIALLARHDNVAILRTLSKAWALAGARIGALVARPELVALLRRIMPPYPLPAPCVATACRVLSGRGPDEMRSHVSTIRAERARVAAALADAAGVVDVLPSRANFVTARWRDSARVYGALIARGIVVRDVGRYAGLAGCLRISIGSPSENDALLAALTASEGVVP